MYADKRSDTDRKTVHNCNKISYTASTLNKINIFLLLAIPSVKKNFRVWFFVNHRQAKSRTLHFTWALRPIIHRTPLNYTYFLPTVVGNVDHVDDDDNQEDLHVIIKILSFTLTWFPFPPSSSASSIIFAVPTETWSHRDKNIAHNFLGTWEGRQGVRYAREKIRVATNKRILKEKQKW